MEHSLEELEIGTYSRVHTVTENTSIIDALRLFVKYRVSALPVVAQSGDLNFSSYSSYVEMHACY